MAEATGGEINPSSTDGLKTTSLTKNFQPVRQPLIVFAFALLLLEIMLRRFVLVSPVTFEVLIQAQVSIKFRASR